MSELALILSQRGDDLREALLRKTERVGACLIYTGSKGPGGYGWFTYKFDQYIYFMNTAHVTMWVLDHGRVPSGLYVLHTCDQPLCVEPAHLRVGSPAENMRDKADRGRQTRGSQFEHAKLNEAQVHQLRLDYAAGVSMPELAKRHAVTLQTIASAVHRRAWKHVN
jgi:hypothetical protein